MNEPTMIIDRPKECGSIASRQHPRYVRWMRFSPNKSDIARFWAKVKKHRVAHPTLGSPCWEWTAGRNPGGHGRFKLHAKNILAHRFAWLNSGRALPAFSHGGLELSHRCHRGWCVNPDHMELVSRSVHMLEPDSAASIRSVKTHCKRGHPFDASNTYITSRGERCCRVCQRAHYRKWSPKRKPKGSAQGVSDG